MLLVVAWCPAYSSTCRLESGVPRTRWHAFWSPGCYIYILRYRFPALWSSVRLAGGCSVFRELVDMSAGVRFALLIPPVRCMPQRRSRVLVGMPSGVRVVTSTSCIIGSPRCGVRCVLLVVARCSANSSTCRLESGSPCLSHQLVACHKVWRNVTRGARGCMVSRVLADMSAGVRVPAYSLACHLESGRLHLQHLVYYGFKPALVFGLFFSTILRMHAAFYIYMWYYGFDWVFYD